MKAVWLVLGIGYNLCRYFQFDHNIETMRLMARLDFCNSMGKLGLTIFHNYTDGEIITKIRTDTCILCT